ncbi:peptide chain release factor N(5)-glutamine methyltransferase [Roseovarius spongiae]|uniref:Release factor glutamine methyltransferase n=1 Tax=Roseovarius spongiae TaxID=2320272 RepID=A0A3A8ATX6_9RHOB|nr:peptide chain release factor N(5)-glutamine methyltransferase [Roseovarius spongiae]RKF15079.1 peptide chain release factor N(5)-glutamine methyltransferase [Roseovarius spongiae]
MKLRDAMQDARRRLELVGVPDAGRDVSALLDAAGAGVEEDMTPEVAARFAAMVESRLRRRPVSQIIGRRAFWMHDFEVTSDVLDPRPETETLVDAARDTGAARVLDLGTGSGCIALSILHELPAARAVATDLSEAALAVARRNADRVGVADRVTFLRSDWFSDVDGQFDLIVSNPPYIAAAEMPGLAPELRHEPRMALTDGADGLSAYRALARGAGAHLASGGWVMLEIGHAQGADVTALLEAAGLRDVTILPDLDGRDRVVRARNPG